MEKLSFYFVFHTFSSFRILQKEQKKKCKATYLHDSETKTLYTQKVTIDITINTKTNINI